MPQNPLDYTGPVHGVVTFSQSLQEVLVEAGFAWWYRKYAPKYKKLANLEAEAREMKRGLWADKNPVPPWEWRRGKNESPTPMAAVSNIEAVRAPGKGRFKVSGIIAKLPNSNVRLAGRPVFHGNTRSKVFHTHGCRHYRCRRGTKVFETVEEATRAGYRPHKRCVGRRPSPRMNCYQACLKQSQAVATSWESVKASCRSQCAEATSGTKVTTSKPPKLPWSKDRVCKKDSDCVLLPTRCPRCRPHCWRPVGNREALKRAESVQASVQCRNPGCRRCRPDYDWLGTKAVCVKGQCEVR
jgi:hypothetical protein